MYSKADALLDVARVFLNTAPQDRSGEDRTLVVVHVCRPELPPEPRILGVRLSLSKPNPLIGRRSRGNVSAC